MRSKTLLTTTLLTLALSTTAAVAQEKWNNRYPNDRYDRYHRSDQYDRYPDARGAQQVAAMAREIENTAASIRQQAERNNRRPDRDEARMLSALRELHEEADHFQDEVGDRRGSQQDVRGFRELLRAYDFTGESLRYVSRRPYVDQGMERIGYLIDQISRAYGYDTRGRYDRNGRGRGQYDRYNRYDRYDRN